MDCITDDDEAMVIQSQTMRDMKTKGKVTEGDLLDITRTKLYSLRHAPGL